MSLERGVAPFKFNLGLVSAHRRAQNQIIVTVARRNGHKPWMMSIFNNDVCDSVQLMWLLFFPFW